MKRTLLAALYASLLATSMSQAGNVTKEASKAEMLYAKKMETARAARDRASEKLQRDYEKHGTFSPEVLMDYKAISEAAFEMGDLDASIEYALFALKVAMKLQREDDPKLAKLYFDTGNKYYMHKQHPTAILYMKKAADIYNNGTGRESLALADTYEGIASTYINLEDFEKSLDYAQKCLDIRKKKLKKSDEKLQTAQMNVDYLKDKLRKK